MPEGLVRYMRVHTFFNAPATFTQLGTYNRATNYIITRPRPVITLDARSQTAYGTLRSYARFGVNINGSGLGAVPFMDRAFIEFAGFTLGQTVSFYDILGYSPFVSYHALWTLGDTGGAGINVLAYTARLGGDVSATLSLEDPLMRRRGIYSTIAGVATNGVKGVAFPDVVGLVSLDKSWGKLADCLARCTMPALRITFPARLPPARRKTRWAMRRRSAAISKFPIIPAIL